MLVGERRRRIVELLTSDDRAEVAELARRFAVSESTIRRDLQQLSAEGVVERTRGGALPPSRFEPTFGDKATTNRSQKISIARAAAALVEPGQTVFLDAGTTTLELARLLRSRSDITVASNSVPVAFELANSARLILTGGTAREATLALVGPLAERAIEQMHADLAFVGMNGVSPQAGLTTPTWEEAATKSRMIATARSAVVLADSSKLGRISFAHVATLGQVDRIITDGGADPADVAALRAAGARVQVVPVDSAEVGSEDHDVLN